MLIRIEPGSGVPITRQIVDQLRARCATGELKAGDRLPSVRELARQLAVNQNTILRAYERLTAEGVLELRHGEGTFVGAFAVGQQLRREKAQLAAEADRLVRRAAILGISPDQIRAVLEEAIERLAKPTAAKPSIAKPSIAKPSIAKPSRDCQGAVKTP